MSCAHLLSPSSPASLTSAVETISSARGRARQFWRVFDGSLVPMVLVDNHRRTVGANAAARLVFRLSLSELLIRRIDDLTPPHLIGTMHELWERLISHGAVCGPFEVGFEDGSELRVTYCALANVLPGQHLIVFVPAKWAGDELRIAVEPQGQPCGPLSTREREVLSLIAAGATNEAIARELTISAATVRTHTRNALRKLGAHNRAHAIALAIRDGVIDLPEQMPSPS